MRHSDSLRDLLLVRVEVLPEDAQQVLRIAAQAGSAVEHALLAAVCELQEETLLAALRAAVGANVLRPTHDGDAAVRAVELARVVGATPTELQARVTLGVLLAECNRQIGQELFISPKTASVHVSNILAKLDVSGRGEAAAGGTSRAAKAQGEHRLRLVPQRHPSRAVG